MRGRRPCFAEDLRRSGLTFAKRLRSSLVRETEWIPISPDSGGEPAWSPNGLLLAFAWVRNYGPGVLGGSDIYLMDIASRQIIQLTHDGGRNDFPSWSPDGRHFVFQSNRTSNEQIWSVLADGTHLQQLTRQGRNSQPNWSFR